MGELATNFKFSLFPPLTRRRSHGQSIPAAEVSQKHDRCFLCALERFLRRIVRGSRQFRLWAVHSSPKKIEAAQFAGHHLNPDAVVRLTNKFKELFMVVGTWRRRKRKRVREIRTLLSGGARRNRTADLLNAIQALSQLSYGPGYLNLRRALYAGRRGAAMTNFQFS